MADPYRFGGPIPESVQRLKKRREWRASSLFARVKRGRREALAEERSAATASGEDWYRAALEPYARSPSCVKDLALADGANEAVVGSHDAAAAKNDGLPAAEAGLADVVRRLIDAWNTGPGLLVGGIAAQRKFSTGEFDQRVFAALIEGSLQFQIFLLQLGQVRLELQKTGVVSEQSLLRLEQLLQKRRSSLVDECGVSQGTHALGELASSGD